MPLPFPPALAAYIEGGGGALCRLLTMTRADGLVYRWTDLDRSITIGGAEYRAGIGFNLSNLDHRGDASVSGGDLEALLAPEGVTRAQLLGGVLDGATAEVSVACYSQPELGAGVIAYGRIGANDEAVPGQTRLELRGLGQALTRQVVPVLTPGCSARFASQPGEEERPCGIDPAAHTVPVSVIAATRDLVAVSGLNPAALYTGGVLGFTSGALSGVRAGVRTADNATGALTLYVPLPEAPAIGDAATLLAGCDKSIETCRDRYANVARFRGFPFVAGGQILTRVAGR